MSDVQEIYWQNKTLITQWDRYRKALEEIAKLGKVCEEFEICNHPACNDSAGAVLIALEALKE